MVSNRGDVECDGGVPTSGFLEDKRDVIFTSRVGGIGAVIGGGGIGCDGSVAY